MPSLAGDAATHPDGSRFLGRCPGPRHPPSPRALDPRGELRSLFEVCAREANDPRLRARGVRDAAMLALLHVGGLRRAELAGLKLSDYDPETKILRLRGKGNKERQVYAEGGADLLLARCLELRGEGEPGDPLFLPVRKDGVVQRTDPHGEKKSSLSDKAVYKMVKRRQREAKFKEVSPTTSARPSWAISSTPYEIYRRFRSSRGIRIPPQPPVTTGARGRCGRPRATCTSPTSAISHPTQGRHTRVPYPFRGAAEALGSQPRASRIT